LGPWPVAAGHVEASLITPVSRAPSDRLLDLALDAAQAARTVDLRWISGRGTDRFPDVWPGEHYKLLNAIVSVLGAKTVVEIGTATGMSALAISAALPRDGKVVTFDLVPWREYPGSVLRDADFSDGRLEQRLEDLSTPSGWRANADLLKQAEFIFVDAKHDGAQERAFMHGFEEVGLDKCPVVLFDDIRVWEMLAFWHEVSRPKLDLTSFGHWSGTGLVDYA
jgi:predicted O-methyltransferase YrrM